MNFENMGNLNDSGIKRPEKSPKDDELIIETFERSIPEKKMGLSGKGNPGEIAEAKKEHKMNVREPEKEIITDFDPNSGFIINEEGNLKVVRPEKKEKDDYFKLLSLIEQNGLLIQARENLSKKGLGSNEIETELINEAKRIAESK